VGSYKDKNAGAQRAQRSIQICLRGDLVAEWEAADRELNRAREERRGSDAKEDGGFGDLVEKVRALEAEMREHTDEWVLRAMPRHKFRALVAAHPPRTDENNEPIEADRQIGLNRDDFFPQLIRASVVSPELDTEDWTWLLGHTDAERTQLIADGKEDQIEDGILTDRQFGDLQDVAWFINRGEVDVPFSHAASLATRDSAGE
jgi:hypothetical protein